MLFMTKGCELVGDSVSETSFDKTIQNVKDADVLIFAGGISSSLEGEEMSVKVDGFRQGDRTNLELPVVQQRLLRELKKLDKPLIFVHCSGSALAINLAEQQGGCHCTGMVRRTGGRNSRCRRFVRRLQPGGAVTRDFLQI